MIFVYDNSPPGFSFAKSKPTQSVAISYRFKKVGFILNLQLLWWNQIKKTIGLTAYPHSRKLMDAVSGYSVSVFPAVGLFGVCISLEVLFGEKDLKVHEQIDNVKAGREVNQDILMSHVPGYQPAVQPAPPPPPEVGVGGTDW